MWSTIVTLVLTLWDYLPEITAVLKLITALINFVVAILLLVHRLGRRSRRHR